MQDTRNETWNGNPVKLYPSIFIPWGIKPKTSGPHNPRVYYAVNVLQSITPETSHQPRTTRQPPLGSGQSDQNLSQEEDGSAGWMNDEVDGESLKHPEEQNNSLTTDWMVFSQTMMAAFSARFALRRHGESHLDNTLSSEQPQSPFSLSTVDGKQQKARFINEHFISINLWNAFEGED